MVTFALVAIILLFIALGTFIAFKTPAYEASDEPGHVRNIETLVDGHWYGMNSKCMFSGRYCTGDEAHQAPLYYLTLAAWQRLAEVPAKPPYSGKARLGTTETSEGFEVHHSSSDHQFLLWLRLPNVLLGALTVLFAFFAVKLVSSDPWTPVVGASIVAFLPRFVFLSSFVTNDNLVDLLGAILTLTALRYARAPTRWRMAVVGAIVGLLVLTKLSVLPIGLVLVVLPLMARDWRTRAEYFGVGVLSTLVVSSWYLIQNTVRYGDPLGLAASTRYLTQVGAVGTFFWTPYRVSNWMSLIVVHVPERILDSFWYQSGWNEFHWSWPVNVIFFLVLAGALAGLVQRHVNYKVVATLSTIAIAGFLSVWGLAFQTGTYQARYAFVGLVAVACLAALGLERWRLPVRFLLPAMGLAGTLIAIQQNVLAVHWSS